MQRLPHIIAAIIAILLIKWATPVAAQSFSITLDIGEGLTPEQQTVFLQAVNYWENIITGYEPLCSSLPPFPSGPTISVLGGTVSSGTTTIAHTSGFQKRWATSLEGETYCYNIGATITFNSAQLNTLWNSGHFYDTAVHEIAHAIGYGVSWVDNRVYEFDEANNVGCYDGSSALAAYQTEFGQPGAEYVPVEVGGGPGTEHCHWDENETFHYYDPENPALGGYYSVASTGIVDSHERDMANELMTGWVVLSSSASSIFISQTTIHQFEDIGYTVLQMPGDANLDGFVDGTDLNTVLSNYNTIDMEWSDGDFNDDTLVNGSDLNTVLSYYNQNNGIYGIYGMDIGGSGGASASMAVPEPGSCALIGSGLLCLLAVGFSWRKRAAL